jgi:hypothetical protein
MFIIIPNNRFISQRLVIAFRNLVTLQIIVAVCSFLSRDLYSSRFGIPENLQVRWSNPITARLGKTKFTMVMDITSLSAGKIYSMYNAVSTIWLENKIKLRKIRFNCPLPSHINLKTLDANPSKKKL